MSAKDLANQAAQDAFNKNFQAIQAYKQQHGGDWEGAYYRVTGQKWPGGKDVEITPQGQGHLVSDPNVLGKVLKIGIPSAIGAATLFGIPGVFGGLIGGGGSAASAGAAGAASGGASAAGAGAAGAAGGVLPSTTIGSGFIGPVGGAGLGAAAAGGGAAAGSSLLGNIIKQYVVPLAANTIGSAIQSHQVSKAAEAQQKATDQARGILQQGTDQAMGINQQVYNQNRPLYDPYIALGQGAATNLRGLIGKG